MSTSCSSNKANDGFKSCSSVSSCCAPSTFSCVKDLGHKLVTLYTSVNNISNPPQPLQAGEGWVGGSGGGGRKKCLWFSKDYGQPIFAMHSNCYLNSECFIIDTGISVLNIQPTYKLILFKEHIHVLEEDDTKFSLEFRDGSDSFAIWIQICTFQNVEPFTTTSVQLTRQSMISLENHFLRSTSGSTPVSSWLTMKFKAPSDLAENKSSNWFTFAKMKLISLTFKKWQYVVFLLKSDDPDEDAPAGLFCIRPGVTCLKTASQLYYEPCDATKRKYILDFDNEALCSHIWNFIMLVTPKDFVFSNDQLKINVDSVSGKLKKIHSLLETKRNRRLKMVYRCFGQMRQEVKQIMKSSKGNLQEIIDMPEIHINKLFFSIPVWAKRCENLGGAVQRIGRDKLKKELGSSFSLQCSNVKLHVRIVKMLMRQHVPAELIAEYRELLARKLDVRSRDKDNVHCRRIHCLFI